MMFRRVATLIAACLWGVAVTATGATAPVVSGGFIQLQGGNASKSAAWWQAELGAMQALGMDTVVVQYAGVDQNYFYPSSIPGVTGSGTDTLERILDAADGLGIDTYLGLQLNSGAFDPLQEGPKGLATLNELNSRYGSHGSLAGWYIPQEISDQIALTNPQLGGDLVAYTGQITQQAHAGTSLPVAISPFFGSSPDAAAYANWWDTTALPAMGIDILALQDGVGTHRTTTAESRVVFEALAPVLQSHGVAFWANNEAFNQTHGPPVDAQPFAAVPTDINTLVGQIASTAPVTDKAITFEFSTYLSPQAGPAQRQLYLDYEAYAQGVGQTGTPIAVAGYSYDNPPGTSFNSQAPDPGQQLLTDGHPGSLIDGAGSAFANGTWVGLGNDTPDGGPQPRLILDLGGEFSVDSVEVFYLVSAGPFIFSPQEVPGVADALTVEASTDGVGFMQAASTNNFVPWSTDQTNGAFERRSVVVDLAGVRASHLALDFRTPNTWVFLGEVLVFEQALAGDFNGNGQVEQGDLDLVLLNWGSNTDTATGGVVPAGWIKDAPVGLVDQAELDRVLLNWGATAEPGGDGPGGAGGASVPEPGCAVALGLVGALGFVRRPRGAVCRRRRASRPGGSAS